MGVRMIGDIKDIFSMLLDLYRSRMDKKYNEFNIYIDEIFNNTKRIEENYLDILSKVRYGIVYGDWTGEEAVRYLSKVEYELKSERIYIREELKYLNKVYNGELEEFVGAVFNIMYCEYVDRFNIGKDIKHRFTGLIQYAENFQLAPFYKERFIEYINHMLDEVNKSWEIICSKYFVLKEKYKNRI